MPDDTVPVHPDDDVVSAVLDGEATSGEHVHVAGCPACTTRLAELRAVTTAVAAPVPPPRPDVRDAAISAALDAANFAVTTPAPVPGRPVVRLARRRWAFPALAAAVVLVALAVALPRLGRHDGGTPLASRAAQEKATAGAVPATVRDLGAIDETTLRAALNGQFATNAAGAAGAAAAPAEPDLATGATGATTPPAPTATPAPGRSSADDVAAVGRCQADLRRQAPSLPPASFAAVGAWTGAPAVVLAFRGGGGEITVYVTARDDCRILHFERFRPGS